MRENDGVCFCRWLRPMLMWRAGYFPVRLETLPEGSVVHANCPIYQARLSGQLAPRAEG